MTVPLYRDSETSRKADVAYHLIPEPVWREQRTNATYEPEAYAEDGFIHLTLGLDPLVIVANLFYTSDPRPYRVLVLDLSQVAAEVKYEDPDRIYPHIYGLLNLDAVIGELSVSRSESGVFLSIDAE